MDKPLGVQQNKIPKTSKKSKNKRPLKVVYISNPKRVKATPSEFRALVQELTGKNAVVPVPHHFPRPDECHVAGDDDFASEVSNVELLESERVKWSDQEFASCNNNDFFMRFLESSLLFESPPR